jgi:hypothetical protein
MSHTPIPTRSLVILASALRAWLARCEQEQQQAARLEQVFGAPVTSEKELSFEFNQPVGAGK